MSIFEQKILVRGAGDLASGILYRLYVSGFKNILALETANPMAVRRQVAFSEAVYTQSCQVEGITARLISQVADCTLAWQQAEIPILVDPTGNCLATFKPDIFIEATLNKKNIGVNLSYAPLVIGIGPGFKAGVDVHVVIESMRGPALGRVIRIGQAEPNTGIPEAVLGFSEQRVIRSPAAGIFMTDLDIGTKVQEKTQIAYIKADSNYPVIAQISGTLRGFLRSGTLVKQNAKLGDIEPRNMALNKISDKALAIAGGTLEAILNSLHKSF